MSEIIKARGLKKIYQMGDVEVRALNGIDISIQEGEFVAIIGSSGSGKSTLLNMLGGLDYPTNGIIQIRNENLAQMSQEELTVFRRRNIGFIFQNYNLVPVLNVYENIVLPLQLDKIREDKSFIREIVNALGIKEKLYQMPNTLSGGQQQRVAIARALSTKPAIILADEPTGNLDSETGKEVMDLICKMAKKYRQTMAVVTHSEEVAKLAQRIIRMKDGKII